MIRPELTVAAVIERDARFLMIEEYVDGYRVLNQPAGHVEPGESITDAAIRETREESAWHITPTALTGVYYWPNTPRGGGILRLAFTGTAEAHDANQPLDDGIIAAHWLHRDELAASRRLRSPLVLAAIDDYCAGVRLPLETVHTMHT